MNKHVTNIDVVVSMWFPAEWKLYHTLETVIPVTPELSVVVVVVVWGLAQMFNEFVSVC